MITIEREKEGAPLCSKVNTPCLVFQVRLLELYDVVDLFVLYEIPYTHMGADKPLYFNDSMSGACMAAWLSGCMAAWL